MRLVIEKDKDISKEFIEYLIKKIQQQILAKINLKKLIQWDNYILNIINNKLIKKVSSKEIILIGLHYLEYKETKKYYIIQINNNIKYKNTNYTIYSLIKLINYGCLGMKGYPIFTDTLKEVDKNLVQYKNRFLTEGPIYARLKII